MWKLQVSVVGNSIYQEEKVPVARRAVWRTCRISATSSTQKIREGGHAASIQSSDRKLSADHGIMRPEQRLHLLQQRESSR